MPPGKPHETERRAGWEFLRDKFNLRREAQKETQRTGIPHSATGRALSSDMEHRKAFGVPDRIVGREKDFIGIVQSRGGKTYWYIDRRRPNDR